MRNAERIAEITKDIVTTDRSTWIGLYYSFIDNDVYSDPVEGTCKVCDLINPNTAQDIKDTITAWKARF